MSGGWTGPGSDGQTADQARHQAHVQDQSQDQDQDQAGAANHCEALLQHTLDAIRPPLTWQPGVPTAGRTLPPGDAAPDDPACWYVSRNRNILTVVSPARRGALLGVVERHWRRSGHLITSVNADHLMPGLYATTAHGYRLGLDFGTVGNAYLTATSPPVARAERIGHPPGTPGIARHPGGPADVAPRPSAFCPFWSAGDVG
ncbi:hypothetical protein ACFVHB_29835 [Kitasatospora sp. NPDC127111]|uniref:hypothetical protein n=1 Tax=Kitasatospora sp. NPDC127111 TaxID=3345363 RepID=UPI003630D2A5